MFVDLTLDRQSQSGKRTLNPAPLKPLQNWDALKRLFHYFI